MKKISSLQERSPCRLLSSFLGLLPGFLLGAALLTTPSAVAWAADDDRARYQTANQFFQEEKYLLAARYYFSVYTGEEGLRYEALGRLTESLILARYPNAASYFYIKTLKSGARGPIQKILKYLPEMIDAVGGDVLGSYVLAHATVADFENENRNHFYYFLGKSFLLKNEPTQALDAFRKVNLSARGMGAPAALLRASAHALAGQLDQAAEFYKTCQRLASRESGAAGFDLENRCRAGQARVLYEAGRFDDAEEVYDDISKKSFVWPDILFEQGWNAFAKNDYNRTLGKLVSYRSPALKFVFNPEIFVLRAQSFMALCLYDDANKTINEFNQSYFNVGSQMKNFLQSHEKDFSGFYNIGKGAMRGKLQTTDMMRKALNGFVRGPHFAAMVKQENATLREAARIRAAWGVKGGFPDFMEKVLAWRLRSVRLLGGVFVRNSMLDLYNDLLADFDKMSFIKTEMLSQMKGKLTRRGAMSEDEDGKMKRGTSEVHRKDYQYYWSFNGEFWNDELGDYVFALESECR